MSGAQTSTFGDPNILYKALSGMGTAEVLQKQNDLLVQQQQIGAGDTEMAARIASTLQGLPTPEARASAYPTMLAQARANGYRLPHAPETYPGDDAIAATARLGTPSTTQQEWQANIAANKAISAANAQPATATMPASSTAPAPATQQPSVPAYGGGTGNVTVPAEYMPYFQEASQRTGIPVDMLIAQARQESGFNPGATGAAGEVGIMQIHPKTAASPGFGLSGVQNPDVLRDPRTNINFGADYLAARAKAIGADLTTPQGQAAALHAYNGGGDPNYVANVFRYMPPSGGGSGTSRPGTVAVGDSLGVGVGQAGKMPTYATEGAQPSAIAARINSDEFPALNGQDVVLSTGASNNPKDLASVEQQIRNLQGKGAGRITVLGVGDRPDLAGVNDKLAALAKAYGADFRPIDPGTLSADRVHPANYAALVPPTAVRGGVSAPPGTPAADGRYLVASNAPTPPPGTVAAPAATPQPQPQLPQPPANRAMPGAADGPAAASPPPAQPAPAGGPPPPQLQPLLPNGLTARQQAILDAQGATGRMTGQQRLAAEQAFVNQNIQLQQKAFSDWIQVQQLQTSQGQLSVAQQNSALEYWKAAHPDAKVTMTGGEIITQNPRTGQEIAPRIQVTPQRADTAAMAIVSRLGPKVANGTATPDEQAQYAVAVDSYRQPTLRENPVTKETVRVNTRELPAGFPEPPGLGGGAPGGPGASGGSNVVMPGLSPAQQQIERDPAKAKVADMQYERNSKEIGAINDSVREAQANNIRVQEMRGILDNISTGPGTGSRAQIAAWLQRWAPASLSGWTRDYGNLDGAAAVEAFTKLGLTGAGQQERSTLGNRGGYQAVKLFQAANPNIDLLNPANSSILATQLINNQANIDYAQSASKHFAEQEQRYGDTHKYTSLEQFDQQWNAQRNPQVYAAAMGAISGQPPAQWTKGLSDAEYDRALQIVSRADPTAVINTKSGRYSMQPQAVTSSAQIKPNDTVIRYDHSGNRLP